MSLILDALRRAERERQSGPVTVLVDRALPERIRPRRRSRRGIVAGIVLAALAAAVLWRVTREPSIPEPQTAPAAAPAPEGGAEPVAPQAVIPGTETVASLDDLAPDPLEPEIPPSPSPSPAPGVLVPGSTTTRTSPSNATIPAPTAAPAPEPEPEPESPAVTEQAPVPAVLTQPAPVRRLKEMPADYRADFPQIRIDIHVYEKDPLKRFVLLNGRRYRHGERMSEGPVVAEIVSDGIVFDFRGEKVLYPLGR